MRRVLSWVAILVLPLLLCTGPTLHAQKGKKGKEKDGDDETKNTTKLIKSGVLVGRVQNVYEDKKRIRLQISYPVTSLDPGAAGQIAQAQAQVQQAMLQLRVARDPNALAQARQQVAQAQQQLVQAQARLYRTQMVNKDIEVQATDDVVVRMASPKLRFNDKGDRVKKYTKAELKELKGDSKLPGYKAEFGDLQTEQIVRVTTVRKKGEKAPVKTPPKKGKKGKGDDNPADGLIDDLPQVSMIEILREPPAPK